MIKIRDERESDHKIVEEITRNAFYNLYVPGCFEHYLVHIMRNHEDFIPELDFVLELNGEVIGNIMYTKAKLIDEKGEIKEILSFGPICVAPEHQRRGYGGMLMEYSFKQAVSLGYDVIVIFGSPKNYVGSGFQCCRKYNIGIEGGKFPAAMMVKELTPGALDGRTRFYSGSPVMAVDEEAARCYDDAQPKMEKKVLPCQEEFYIMSRSFVE